MICKIKVFVNTGLQVKAREYYSLYFFPHFLKMHIYFISLCHLHSAFSVFLNSNSHLKEFSFRSCYLSAPPTHTPPSSRVVGIFFFGGGKDLEWLYNCSDSEAFHFQLLSFFCVENRRWWFDPRVVWRSSGKHSYKKLLVQTHCSVWSSSARLLGSLWSSIIILNWPWVWAC